MVEDSDDGSTGNAIDISDAIDDSNDDDASSARNSLAYG